MVLNNITSRHHTRRGLKLLLNIAVIESNDARAWPHNSVARFHLLRCILEQKMYLPNSKKVFFKMFLSINGNSYINMDRCLLKTRPMFAPCYYIPLPFIRICQSSRVLPNLEFPTLLSITEQTNRVVTPFSASIFFKTFSQSC